VFSEVGKVYQENITPAMQKKDNALKSSISV
jgi:hypothetical protein